MHYFDERRDCARVCVLLTGGGRQGASHALLLGPRTHKHSELACMRGARAPESGPGMALRACAGWDCEGACCLLHCGVVWQPLPAPHRTCPPCTRTCMHACHAHGPPHTCMRAASAATQPRPHVYTCIYASTPTLCGTYANHRCRTVPAAPTPPTPPHGHRAPPGGAARVGLERAARATAPREPAQGRQRHDGHVQAARPLPGCAAQPAAALTRHTTVRMMALAALLPPHCVYCMPCAYGVRSLDPACCLRQGRTLCGCSLTIWRACMFNNTHMPHGSDAQMQCRGSPHQAHDDRLLTPSGAASSAGRLAVVAHHSLHSRIYTHCTPAYTHGVQVGAPGVHLPHVTDLPFF